MTVTDTTSKGKNIVLCIDGTGNQFGEENSNVVKLFSILRKDTREQRVYYHPGVGTMSDPRMVTPVSKELSKLLGLGLGVGFQGIVRDAYDFIMENHEENDRIFIFGFSRGAFVVRALAGFLYKCGLLEKGNQNLFPYAYKLYKASARSEIADKFRAVYSRPCAPYFLGLWDTVTSLGWIYRRTTFPYTAYNPSVRIVRHAISIDERRAYYRQNLWGYGRTKEMNDEQDVRQVWFAGVHSDVGGSYPEAQCGLSKITLEWMVEEAVAKGLLVDRDRYLKVVFGEGVTDGEKIARPDCKAQLHKSLHGAWWLMEYIPKNETLKRYKFYLPRGKRRTIPDQSVIHRSALDRVRDVPDYNPPNLPEKYEVEEYRRSIGAEGL